MKLDEDKDELEDNFGLQASDDEEETHFLDLGRQQEVIFRLVKTIIYILNYIYFNINYFNWELDVRSTLLYWFKTKFNTHGDDGVTVSTLTLIL